MSVEAHDPSTSLLHGCRSLCSFYEPHPCLLRLVLLLQASSVVLEACAYSRSLVHGGKDSCFF